MPGESPPGCQRLSNVTVGSLVPTGIDPETRSMDWKAQTISISIAPVEVNDLGAVLIGVVVLRGQVGQPCVRRIADRIHLEGEGKAQPFEQGSDRFGCGTGLAEGIQTAGCSVCRRTPPFACHGG